MNGNFCFTVDLHAGGVMAMI